MNSLVRGEGIASNEELGIILKGLLLAVFVLDDEDYRIIGTRYLVQSFDVTYQGPPQLPLSKFVMFIPGLPEAYVKFYVEECYEFDYQDYFEGALELGEDNGDVITALEKIGDVFELTYDTFDGCMNLLENYDDNYQCNHASLYDYIDSKMGEYSEVAINDKVALMEDDTIIPEDKLYDIPSNESVGVNMRSVAHAITEAVSLLTGKKNIPAIEIKDSADEDIMVASLLLVSELKKKEEDGLLFVKLINDNKDKVEGSEDDLFRRFGPCNPRAGYMGIKFDYTDDPCMKYGGCRMLTCWEYVDTDEDEDSDIHIEWYTGYCDYCKLAIRTKCAAIRQPIQNGGWSGCYCSWNCSRQDTADGVVIMMCDMFQTDYDKIGIYDREMTSLNTVTPMSDEKFESIFASLESIGDAS